MNFDPQKFFVGLVDFFSILLPGAAITMLVADTVGPALFGGRYGTLTGAPAWAVFLFSSYLTGHLVFLLSSLLDGPYDWLRRHTRDRQIADVAAGRPLSSSFVRCCAWMVFGRERSLAVKSVVKLKERSLSGAGAGNAVHAFQWSKALLNIESPESFSAVQRFEADSKFFRCFAVVLSLAIVLWPLHRRWPFWEMLLVILPLLLLTIWRYMDQRFKSTNQAYWSVLTLKTRDGKAPIADGGSRPAGPSHAGGVVYRRVGQAVEFLLVESGDDAERWVLPKGHVERGESCRETAIRGVLEKTGQWARIVDELMPVEYEVGGKPVEMRVFLMEAIGRGRRDDDARNSRWFGPDGPDRKDGFKPLHDETARCLAEARRSSSRRLSR